MMSTPEAITGARTSALAAGLGGIRGVLFDIDDTLVDLEFAMTAALPRSRRCSLKVSSPARYRS